MIRSFRSRALRRYWSKDETRKLQPAHVKRIRLLLDRLDASTVPDDMNLPGFAFHKMRGPNRSPRYAVEVQGPWRITFGWDDGDAIEVDYEDYH